MNYLPWYSWIKAIPNSIITIARRYPYKRMSRIKKGYESGKYLAAKYGTNEVGSVIGLHSTERTSDGYLTVILTIKKYHPTADYFELEVVTVCKTKTMDGWKEKTEDGKTLNHPERGQLNLWDQEGIQYRGKHDD